jgi:hypothetical protein
VVVKRTRSARQLGGLGPSCVGEKRRGGGEHPEATTRLSPGVLFVNFGGWVTTPYRQVHTSSSARLGLMTAKDYFLFTRPPSREASLLFQSLARS